MELSTIATTWGPAGADLILLRGRTGIFELGLFCHTLFTAYKLHDSTKDGGAVLAVVTAVLVAFGGGILVPVLLGNDVFFPFPFANDLAVPFVALNVLALRRFGAPRLESGSEDGWAPRLRAALLAVPSALVAVVAEVTRARIMLTWLRGSQKALPPSYFPEPVMGPILLGSE